MAAISAWKLASSASRRDRTAARTAAASSAGGRALSRTTRYDESCAKSCGRSGVIASALIAGPRSPSGAAFSISLASFTPDAGAHHCSGRSRNARGFGGVGGGGPRPSLRRSREPSSGSRRRLGGSSPPPSLSSASSSLSPKKPSRSSPPPSGRRSRKASIEPSACAARRLLRRPPAAAAAAAAAPRRAARRRPQPQRRRPLGGPAVVAERGGGARVGVELGEREQAPGVRGERRPAVEPERLVLAVGAGSRPPARAHDALPRAGGTVQQRADAVDAGRAHAAPAAVLAGLPRLGAGQELGAKVAVPVLPRERRAVGDGGGRGARACGGGRTRRGGGGERIRRGAAAETASPARLVDDVVRHARLRPLALLRQQPLRKYPHAVVVALRRRVGVLIAGGGVGVQCAARDSVAILEDGLRRQHESGAAVNRSSRHGARKCARELDRALHSRRLALAARLAASLATPTLGDRRRATSSDGGRQTAQLWASSVCLCSTIRPSTARRRQSV